jgi:hypothetical protein
VSILCSLTDTKVKVLCVVMYSNIVSWWCLVPTEMKGTITHLYVWILCLLCLPSQAVTRSEPGGISPNYANWGNVGDPKSKLRNDVVEFGSGLAALGVCAAPSVAISTMVETNAAYGIDDPVSLLRLASAPPWCAC